MWRRHMHDVLRIEEVKLSTLHEHHRSPFYCDTAWAWLTGVYVARVYAHALRVCTEFGAYYAGE